MKLFTALLVLFTSSVFAQTTTTNTTSSGAGTMTQVSNSKDLPTLPYLYVGGSGQFTFLITANSATYTPVAPYVESVVWTSSDPAAVLTPNPANSALLTVAIPTTDASTTITLTATCKAPDGSSLVVNLTVPILPIPITYIGVVIENSASVPATGQ